MHAHLINYRDLKIVTTDTVGHFQMYAHPGDSIMINHLSLQPQIIHVPNRNTKDTIIYVSYRLNLIGTVFSSGQEELKMKYFENNKKAIGLTLQLTDLTPNISRTMRVSPYNPDEPDPGLNFPVFELISRWIKKRKERKGH